MKLLTIIALSFFTLNSSFAADVLKWDFEKQINRFAGGKGTLEKTGHKSKGSIKCVSTKGDWYDAVIKTKWDKGGYCTIPKPKQAKISFSYKTGKGINGAIILESANGKAKFALKSLQSQKWATSTLPFSSAESNTLQDGDQILSITFKLDTKDDQTELWIDNLKITSPK